MHRPRDNCKLEIWPERPRYFHAAMHHARAGVGGGVVTHQWGWHISRGWHIPGGGVDLGPYLVDRKQRVTSTGGKAKVSSSLNHGLLQCYYAK